MSWPTGTPADGQEHTEGIDTFTYQASANAWTKTGTGAASAAPTATDLGYTHNQTAAAAFWNINHGLVFEPQATVSDTAGNEVIYLDISHPAAGQTVITFLTPIAGTARLS